MMLVRINRASIKRNKNAGNTRTPVFGNYELRFVFTGNKLPGWLIDGKNIHIVSQDSTGRIEGFYDDPDLTDKLITVDGMQITAERNVEFLSHLPEPKWHFKYDNPPVRCNSCHKQTLNNDIEIDYDDDGNRWESCPNCRAVDSFEERVYEDIDEVVNNVTPKDTEQ